MELFLDTVGNLLVGFLNAANWLVIGFRALIPDQMEPFAVMALIALTVISTIKTLQHKFGNA